MRDLSGHDKKATDQGHSRPRDGRARDLSGHEKKPIDRGALTSAKVQKACKALIRAACLVRTAIQVMII